MSIELYNKFKDRFTNTAPIRGRSVECRPISKRTRDWEQVVKRWAVENGALDMEGEWSYGAHLYQTDCVMYMSNGDIHVKTGGWDTPTTAEFISRWQPYSMRCYKKYNKIWVEYKGQNYPIDTTKPTVFKFNTDTDSYAVTDAKPMLQKVIDRIKMKEARQKLEGFRTYVKMMLKLGDGWISNDLVEQHEQKDAGNDYWGRKTFKVGERTMSPYAMSGSLSSRDAQELYTAFCTEDDTQYPKLLCIITSSSNYLASRTVAYKEVEYKDYKGNPLKRNIEIQEHQYDYKTVDNRINYIIKQACDVYTTKEVPVGKVVTNLV